MDPFRDDDDDMDPFGMDDSDGEDGAKVAEDEAGKSTTMKNAVALAAKQSAERRRRQEIEVARRKRSEIGRAKGKKERTRRNKPSSASSKRSDFEEASSGFGGFAKHSGRRRASHGGTTSSVMPSAPSFAAMSPFIQKPLCQYFMQGHCRNGQFCPNRHPSSRPSICQYFLSGYCRNGNSCPQLHPDNGRRSRGSRRISARAPRTGQGNNLCPYFVSGYCRDGTRCSMLHSIGGAGNRTGLDLDHMSMDDIMALEAKIGDVPTRENTPLTRAQLDQLPTWTFRMHDRSTLKDGTGSCSICLVDFDDSDVMMTTPCFHAFHKVCIAAWLTKEKPSCPICKKIVDVTGRASIPCKYFVEGFCREGDDCPFSHNTDLCKPAGVASKTSREFRRVTRRPSFDDDGSGVEESGWLSG